MSGTRIGGLKTAATNKERYGKDFYKNIGRQGGSMPTLKPKGFAANPELAKKAGRKGGSISRRGPAKPKPEVDKPAVKKHWWRFW